MKCNTCQNELYCYDDNHQLTRDRCADNGFAAYVPQTNADRIRAMADEELARYYAKRIVRCYGCEAVTEDDCFECQMYWLKASVEEGG